MAQQTIKLEDASLEQLRVFETAFINQYGAQSHSRDIAGQLYQIHEEMAKKQFPDIDYKQYLKDRHENTPVKTYLEIGVRWGDALALATEDCKAVGVDPAFDIRETIQADATLFKLTSDDFFFEHTETYRNTFDMIFVDGLHEAKQTAKDICHAFAVLKEGGEIFVHDAMPVALSVTAPVQHTRFWTGNVWQAAAAFCVPGAPYKWEFVPAFPSGLFRIYDVDPDYVPSGNAVMKSLKSVKGHKFSNASQLLEHLTNL